MQSTSGNYSHPSQGRGIARFCRFAVRFIAGTLVIAAAVRPIASEASGPSTVTVRPTSVAYFLQSLTRPQISQFSSIFSDLDRISGGVISPMIGQSVPMFMSVCPSNAVGGIDKLSVTVKVSQVGDCVQIGTDTPWLVNSPSSVWPYNISYPCGGSDTRTVTFSTNAVSTNHTVKIYACRSGVDASNPANWSFVQSVTILPVR
jgi:hypothetical protein